MKKIYDDNIKNLKPSLQPFAQYEFECKFCKKFYSHDDYINHISLNHSKQKQVCSICEKRPGGDPNYTSAYITGHFSERHDKNKFYSPSN